MLGILRLRWCGSWNMCMFSLFCWLSLGFQNDSTTTTYIRVVRFHYWFSRVDGNHTEYFMMLLFEGKSRWEPYKSLEIDSKHWAALKYSALAMGRGFRIYQGWIAISICRIEVCLNDSQYETWQIYIPDSKLENHLSRATRYKSQWNTSAWQTQSISDCNCMLSSQSRQVISVYGLSIDGESPPHTHTCTNNIQHRYRYYIVHGLTIFRIQFTCFPFWPILSHCLQLIC